MKSYTAPESSKRLEHTVRLKFLHGEYAAELETNVDGKITGADVLKIFVDDIRDLTVPVDHELTKKHVKFIEIEGESYDGFTHRYPDLIRFIHPTTQEEIVDDLDVAGEHLVSIEIVDYAEL